MVNFLEEWQTCLVIGATSGIGKAFAERFLSLSSGKRVVVAGRRVDKLEDLVERFGDARVVAVQLDITDFAHLKDKVAECMNKFDGRIDCVYAGSGVQRAQNFLKPGEIDIEAAEMETTTNWTSYIHLTTHLMPYLLSTPDSPKPAKSLLIVTSCLALVPMIRCPVYCATKAALHMFILGLRQQLKDSNVTILETLPPTVESELHDAAHQPDLAYDKQPDGKRPSNEMPLEEFTSHLFDALKAGSLDIPVGRGVPDWEATQPTLLKRIDQLTK